MNCDHCMIILEGWKVNGHACICCHRPEDCIVFTPRAEEEPRMSRGLPCYSPATGLIPLVHSLIAYKAMSVVLRLKKEFTSTAIFRTGAIICNISKTMHLHRRLMFSSASIIPLSCGRFATPEQRLTSSTLCNESSAIFSHPRIVSIQQFHSLHHQNTKSQQPQPDLKWWQQYSHGPYKYTDSNPWTLHPDATRFANELLTAPENDIGDGVRIIKMKSYLQRNEAHSPDIFSRVDSRNLWNHVYEYTKSETITHAAVTGNAGIGKSRSMVWFLRRLLRDGKCVVYEPREMRTWYVFVPTKERVTIDTSDTGEQMHFAKYEVWSVSAKAFHFGACTALMNPDNYYLIDTSNKTRSTLVAVAHTVVVASPDEAHYKEFLKKPGSVKFFLPMWMKDELAAMSKYFPVTMRDGQERILTQEEFEERFMYCGGRPRYIFAGDVQYDNFQSELVRDTSSVAKNVLLAALNPSQSSIEIESYRRYPISNQVFAYYINSNVRKGSEYKAWGGRVQIACEYALVHLYAKYYPALMNRMNPKFPPRWWNAGLPRAIADEYAKIAFHEQHFHVRRLTSRSQVKTLRCPPVTMVMEKRTWSDFLNKASQLPLSANLKHRVLLYGSLGQPIVGMVDARDRGFQVTTSDKRPINGKLLGQLIETLLGKNSTKAFHLYFVVPGVSNSSSQRDRFTRFKAQPIEFSYAKKKQKDGSEIVETLAEYCSLSEEEIRKRTIQHVLRLPIDLISAHKVIGARVETLHEIYDVDFAYELSEPKRVKRAQRHGISMKAKRHLKYFLNQLYVIKRTLENLKGSSSEETESLHK